MPKNSYQQIKIDENKVIAELLRNSNESIDNIAKRCGFSRQKVWRVIKKLEEEKTIWGYTAAIDEKKLGRNTYIALFKAKAPLSDVDKSIQKIKENETAEFGVTLSEVHYLNGIYDGIILFSAKNTATAKKFCSYVQKKFPNAERIELLESLFPLVSFRMINPQIENFREFTVD
jgi:DNA-binding Lrp family transcriptional regulator